MVDLETEQGAATGQPGRLRSAGSTVSASPLAAVGRVVTDRLLRTPVLGIALSYLLLVLVFSWLTPRFLTATNLGIVAGQTAAVTIAAFAMTMVILSGGIDLSVGAVLALSTVVVGVTLQAGWTLPAAIAAAIGAAALIGLVNGLVTVRWNVQPFLVTLGTLSIARGAAEFIADGGTVAILDRRFVDLFAAKVAGVPVAALWTLAFLVISHVTLHHTVFGRRLYAIGGNEQAAIQAGTRVGRVKVIVYLLSGLFTGVAAMVTSARLASGLPGSGLGFELDVIAAVVLGGTGFRGEGGSVVGTLFGALVIGTVGNGLTLLGVNPFIQKVVKGLIILAAIVLDAVRSRRQGARA